MSYRLNWTPSRLPPAPPTPLSSVLCPRDASRFRYGNVRCYGGTFKSRPPLRNDSPQPQAKGRPARPGLGRGPLRRGPESPPGRPDSVGAGGRGGHFPST